MILSFLGTFCFLFSRVPLVYNYNCNSQPALFLFLFLQRELYCQIQRRILAHTQRRVNTIILTQKDNESYSFFVPLGKPSLCTQPKSTIIQISPGFRLSRRLCQIPPSYCTTENSFFASHIQTFLSLSKWRRLSTFIKLAFCPTKNPHLGHFNRYRQVEVWRPSSNIS